MLQTQHIYNKKKTEQKPKTKIKIRVIPAVSYIHLDWQWYIQQVIFQKANF